MARASDLARKGVGFIPGEDDDDGWSKEGVGETLPPLEPVGEWFNEEGAEDRGVAIWMRSWSQSCLSDSWRA